MPSEQEAYSSPEVFDKWCKRIYPENMLKQDARKDNLYESINLNGRGYK
jgi:hypothetical protein